MKASTRPGGRLNGPADRRKLRLALDETRRLLAERASSPEFEAKLQEAFGGDGGGSASLGRVVRQLTQQLRRGRQLAAVQLSEGSALAGEVARFELNGRGRPRILLSRAWLASTSDTTAVVQVLVEQISQAIQARLRPGDSLGERAVRLLLGGALSDSLPPEPDSPLATSPVVPLALFALQGQATPALQASLVEAQHRILAWLQADHHPLSSLHQAFSGGSSEPDQAWQTRAQIFLDAVLAGQHSVRVELRSSTELLGAQGAFAGSGPDGQPVIFVNSAWAAGASSAEFTRLILEEAGHWIDHQLNGTTDTPGDEGEAFAANLLNLELSDADWSRISSENDATKLTIDGIEIDAELAILDRFVFSHAYQVTNVADKETNYHFFNLANGYSTVSIDDQQASRSFSGNDVSVVLNLSGAFGAATNTIRYGWISRPIKVGGIVRGFYFWSDADFVTLQAAQTDNNTDGDMNPADNTGYVLVVRGQESFFSRGEIGSSSDRVSASLNELLSLNNTAPTAVADTATAVESGGAFNATGGTNPTGNVLTNDSDANTSSGDTKTVAAVGTISASQPVTGSTTSANGTVVSGRFGSLTLGADGSYIYEVHNNNATVEALRTPSETLTDSFAYTMVDSLGLPSTAKLTVTIQGNNDNPIANNDFNTAKESLLIDGTEYTSVDKLGSKAVGNVLTNDSDVDAGDTKTVIASSITGSATGTVTTGSTSTTTLSFTVLNNSVKTGYFVFIDPAKEKVTIDGNPGSTHITIQSIDTVNKTFTLSHPIPDFYTTGSTPKIQNGTTLGFASNTSGGSNYKTSSISGISTGDSSLINLSGITGTIAVGMTVSGTGVNQDPTVTDVIYNGAGVVTGVRVNAALSTFSGTALSFNDSASGSQLVLQGAYGVLELAANGSYTYTPFTDNPDLLDGETKQEVFTYQMRDMAGAISTATLTIDVVGSGSTDPDAQPDTATAVETGGPLINQTGGTNPTGNVLTNDTTPNGTNSLVVNGVTTVDSASFSAVAGNTTSANGTVVIGRFGSLRLGSDGTYTYTVDNANGTVQALNLEDTLVETFRYRVTNSAGKTDTSTLTITINGANDNPVANNDTARASEAGGSSSTPIAAVNPSGNVLDNDTDVDNTDLSVSAVRTGSTEGSGTPGTLGQALQGTYGVLTLNADGSWTYVVDQTNAAVNALSAGDTLVEHFNYTVSDDAATDIALLTITIDGTEDLLEINNVVVNEASLFAVFTVSGQPGQAVTLALGNTLPPNYKTATPGVDYTDSLEVFNGTAWIAYDPSNLPLIPNGGSLLVRVPIKPDNIHEGDESFTLTATTTDGNSAIGIGTINDEGQGAIYLRNNTTGTPNQPGDTDPDPDPGAPDYPANLDNDTPLIAITNATVAENAGFAAVTVSLSNPSASTITFNPFLTSRTASQATSQTPASDGSEDFGPGLEWLDGSTWKPVTGPLSFSPPGQTSLQLRTTIVDDSSYENSEFFEINTGPVTSGTVANPSGSIGKVTITDNDPQPPLGTLGVSTVTTGAEVGTTDGDTSGQQSNLFRFSRTGDNTAPLVVSFRLLTSAKLGTDFLAPTSTSPITFDPATLTGTITIQGGQNTADLSVPTVNNLTVDGTRGVGVTFTADPRYTTSSSTAQGFILDNDTPPTPVVSIGKGNVVESDLGQQRVVNLTLKLSGPSTQDITIEYDVIEATQDDLYVTPGDSNSGIRQGPGGGDLQIATPGDDYTVISGSVVMKAGLTSTIIQIPVLGDNIEENDEVFYARIKSISPGSGATISNSENRGEIIIIDNENTNGLTIDYTDSPVAMDIRGGTLNDSLTGSAFNDTIYGYEGDDYIFGGGGADLLTGGIGSDRFGYSAFAQSTFSSMDRIRDFRAGGGLTTPLDRIQFSGLAAGTVGFSNGAPGALFNATLSTALTDLQAAAEAAFADKDPITAGNQALASGEAVIFTQRSGRITNHFLAVNSGAAGFSTSEDFLVNITGWNSTSFARGQLAVSDFFST